MKKSLLYFASLAALVLVAVSCEQKPALTLKPSEVTLKVGETVTLQPGTEGEGVDFNKSKIVAGVEGEEDIAHMDSYYTVHAGTRTGTTMVGIVIFNKYDEDGEPDTKSGYKYSAFTTVHVVE